MNRVNIDSFQRPLSDIALAAVFLVAFELQVGFAPDIGNRWASGVLALLQVAPLLARSRWPIFALLSCAAVGAAVALTGNALDHVEDPMLPVLLLCFAVGAMRSRGQGLPALAVVTALLALASTQPDVTAGSIVAALVLPVSLWGIGQIFRERSLRAAAFRELAELLDAARDNQEELARLAERARIGAELHDILAQDISAIIVAAGGARTLIRTDPDRARNGLLAVEHAVRSALTELRRSLRLLRDPDDKTTEPVARPSLTRLDDLFARRGLDGPARITGTPSRLPLGIDLLGYRLIETALSAGSPTQVTVGYAPSSVTIDIVAEQGGATLDARLSATTQRLDLYDVTMRIVPHGRHGFHLHANLPLREGA